jgi:hypothetical protein
MGKPYSQNLRERVIAAMNDGGDAYELAPLFSDKRFVHLQVFGSSPPDGGDHGLFATAGATAEAGAL